MPVACMSGGAGRQTIASPSPRALSRLVAARSASSESGTGSPMSTKPLAQATGYSHEWRTSTPLGWPVVPPVYMSQWSTPRAARGSGTAVAITCS